MNNIKLTLTNWGDLDLGGESAIPLNFNLNDIRDISTRGGEYSKTIKLYGTARNNAILGPLFDVNTEFLTVNPQRIEPCTLSRDGEVVLDGTFQIRRILKRYTTEGFVIIYDVYLKSNNSDFYTIIDGKFLTDLDISEYNHFHSKDVIINSIKSGTYLDGYQYFLSDAPIVSWPINSGNLLHLYEPQDFKPAMYVKSILDRIFLEAGFTYEFDELYEHNIDKLIITTNKEEIIPGLIGNLFRAGITQFNSYLTSKWRYLNSVIVSGGIFSFGNQLVTYYPNNNVIFDNDTTSELNFFDVGNQYNNVVGEYVLNPNDNAVYFESTFIINTWVKFNVDMSEFGYPSNQSITTQPNLMMFPNQQGVILQNSSQVIKQKITAYLFAVDANDNILMPPIAIKEVGINEFNSSQSWNLVNLNNYTNELIVNISGEFIRVQNPSAVKVRLILRDDWTEGTYPFQGFYWNGQGYLGDSISPGAFVNVGDLQNEKITTQFGFDTFPTNPYGYFKNDFSRSLVEGAYINMNNVLPTDFKQSDFLLSLIKMYNLYIIDDKNNPKNLIIKTRDRFYEEGEELDWNKKVDINSIEIDILSNSQTKIKNFLYAEDSDDAILKSYKDFTKYDYGQLQYIFFNQFIKDSSEIRPDFSTAILEWKYKKNIPLIPSRAKTSVKIMSVGQLYTDDTYFTYRIANDIGEGQGYVLLTEDQFVYRHVGHFYPNSFEPKEDINFGVSEFYTHNYSTITDNNLFNRFYRTQYDIFEKGYMMKAKFKLNELDISSLKMNERIFVNNSWWNINRIIDFDLNSNTLTEVELISADSSIGEFIPNQNLFINKRLMGTEINNWGNINEKSNKMNNTNGSEVYGKSNKIEDTNNTLVIGDFNYVKNNNGLVIGSSNYVNGSGIIVLGGFNKSYEGKGKVYINGLIEEVDLIDACENEVRNPFGDTSIHLIDGSVDEVMNIGSDTNIHLIDGGTD